MRTSPAPSAFRLLVLAVAAVGACGGDRGAAKGAAGDLGGTIVVAVGSDPATLFPPLVADQSAADVRDQIYDRLADMPADMSTIGDQGYRPRLARRWTWAPDSLSIAFALDPRARFHDGTPVRASDVRWSFQTFADPKVASPSAPLLSNVDSVAARDSLTAVVFFRKRRPEQFYEFVYNVYVMPEHQFRGIAPSELKTAEATRHPIGSGRFRFVRWDAGQRLELLADTANYRGRAKLDRVIFTPMADPGTGVTQLLTGQADFDEYVPPDLAPKVDSAPSTRVIAIPTLAYAYVGMNLHDPRHAAQPHPLFGDVRVRRALSMAVDRQAMLQNVFGKLGRLSPGPFPRTMPGADTTLKLPAFDVAAAKALLDSAGWREPSPGAVRVKNGQPLRFTLLVPTSSRPRMSYAVLIQDQLRKVGAQVDLEQIQANTFQTRQNAHDFDAALISWSTDPSPSGLKQSWTTAAAKPGGQNFVGYSSPAVDAQLDSTLASFSPAVARQHASRALQAIVNDAPGIWLYDILVLGGAHKRLRVVDVRADGWWAGLADWTIPADQRTDRDRLGLAPARR